jgi:hypothetical protein
MDVETNRMSSKKSSLIWEGKFKSRIEVKCEMFQANIPEIINTRYNFLKTLILIRIAKTKKKRFNNISEVARITVKSYEYHL